jgi:hypothetical protein
MLFANGVLILPINGFLNKSIKLIFNYILGPMLFVLVVYSLYNQISQQQDLLIRWQQIKLSWKNPIFWLVFLLMFLNWGLESLKWKLLLKPLENIRFVKAFKSVFAGCSITMITPNRTGEFGGRILFVEAENRIKAISTNILGSISQMLITSIIGCVGLICLIYFLNLDSKLMLLPWIFNDVNIYLSLGVTIILAMFYFKTHFFIVFISKFKFLHKIVQHVKVIEQFSKYELLIILFCSFLRYLVFILQYILIMHVMHVEMESSIAFWLVGVFYLMMAIIPTIGFTELPIRSALGISIFGILSTNILGIQVACFSIWIINLVIPATIGGLFLLIKKEV